MQTQYGENSYSLPRLGGQAGLGGRGRRQLLAGHSKFLMSQYQDGISLKCMKIKIRTDLGWILNPPLRVQEMISFTMLTKILVARKYFVIIGWKSVR